MAVSPRTQKLSLTPMGTPSSAPSGAFLFHLSVDAPTSFSSAASSVKLTKALRSLMALAAATEEARTSAGVEVPREKAEEREESSYTTEGGKRAKTEGGKRKALTRTPVATLAGHKEGVSGVAWMGEGEVVTASWDHTIKVS